MLKKMNDDQNDQNFKLTDIPDDLINLIYESLDDPKSQVNFRNTNSLTRTLLKDKQLVSIKNVEIIPHTRTHIKKLNINKYKTPKKSQFWNSYNMEEHNQISVNICYFIDIDNRTQLIIDDNGQIYMTRNNKYILNLNIKISKYKLTKTEISKFGNSISYVSSIEIENNYLQIYEKVEHSRGYLLIIYKNKFTWVSGYKGYDFLYNDNDSMSDPVEFHNYIYDSSIVKIDMNNYILIENDIYRYLGTKYDDKEIIKMIGNIYQKSFNSHRSRFIFYKSDKIIIPLYETYYIDHSERNKKLSEFDDSMMTDKKFYSNKRYLSELLIELDKKYS